MRDTEGTGPLLARCIVCRGNIHTDDEYEIWEEAYYCERHSASRLRVRAQEYAALLARETVTDKTE